MAVVTWLSNQPEYSLSRWPEELARLFTDTVGTYLNVIHLQKKNGASDSKRSLLQPIYRSLRIVQIESGMLLRPICSL